MRNATATMYQHLALELASVYREALRLLRYMHARSIPGSDGSELLLLWRLMLSEHAYNVVERIEDQAPHRNRFGTKALTTHRTKKQAFATAEQILHHRLRSVP